MNRNSIYTTTGVLGILGAMGYAVYSLSQGNLRMQTQECPGTYTEQVKELTRPLHNRVELTRHDDLILTLKDYDGQTVDWNSLRAEQDIKRDHIDAVRIRTHGLDQTFTPADSNSNTLSGQNARDWLVKGDSLYHATRQCFIDWARRDYLKTHPQARDFLK